MSKLITVFGATGNQGGSVVKHILNDATLSKEFKIRGVTRDTTKPAAQALAKQGVELVSADLNSKDSLRAALHGSHTVFLVTNYWETVSSVTEISQGKNVADVALEAGVQHIIYSSLLNVTRLTNGRLKNVPHFDGKAEVEQYIRDIGLPSTFYLPGFFMSNFSQMVKADEEGTLTWAVPITDEAKFPLIAIKEDTGKFITAIIKQRDSLLGARILGSEDYYPAKDILATIGEVTGKKTKFVQVDDATYKTFLPEFMAQEMLENHLLIQEPGYYGGESLEKSHAILDQKLTTWKEFVIENKVGA